MTEGGAGSGSGPDRVRSIAVHREDVANALEATLRSDREVVLRATPPFSGRMRARLHALDAGGDGADEGDAGGSGDAPAPVRIDPRDLVADAPPYPEVDDTAAELPDADLETRRERHAANVEAWRETVRERVAETVEIEVGGETHTVDVTALG
jgi:hypothetical protein